MKELASLPQRKGALGPYNGLRMDLAKQLRTTLVDDDGGFSFSLRAQASLYNPEVVVAGLHRLANELEGEKL